MRHVLMDPRFPDIVGGWAREALNDNGAGPADLSRDGDLNDDLLHRPFDPQDLTWIGSPSSTGNRPDWLTDLAGREIERTRDW
jgi:hypothetical protein